MPLTRVSLRAGQAGRLSAGHSRRALRGDARDLDVPEDDFFMLVTEHDAADFSCSAPVMASPQR